jgi:hypothetical protein
VHLRTSRTHAARAVTAQAQDSPDSPGLSLKEGGTHLPGAGLLGPSLPVREDGRPSLGVLRSSNRAPKPESRQMTHISMLDPACREAEICRCSRSGRFSWER